EERGADEEYDDRHTVRHHRPGRDQHQATGHVRERGEHQEQFQHEHSPPREGAEEYRASTLRCQVLCCNAGRPLPEVYAGNPLTIDFSTAGLPLSPAASHRCNVGVTHPLKIVGGERGPEPAAAIEYELGAMIGNSLFNVALEHAAPHVLGAPYVSGSPFALLADIDHPRCAGVPLLAGFLAADFPNAPFAVLHALETPRRLLHRPA